MKAVKEAKRPVSGRGRTGRDGAIDLALKMETPQSMPLRSTNTSTALSRLSAHRHEALRPLSKRPSPALTAHYAISVGSRCSALAGISMQESHGTIR